MLATHIPKFDLSFFRQQAISARILGEVKQYICSSTIHIERELWAAPRNAADMRTWREASAQPSKLEVEIPPLEDLRQKQLLLPTQAWQKGEYICVTPVKSMGVVNELYKRLENLPAISRTLQPVAAALSSHGETLLMHAGRVRMLRQPVASLEQNSWDGECVQIVLQLENVNLGAGLFSTGLPALSAIGGTVHVLERKFGLDLQFAYGARDISINVGGKKYSKIKGSDKTIPGTVLNEVNGRCTLILLIKGINHIPLSMIRKEIGEIRRIAGGTFFEASISRAAGTDVEPALYLCKADLDSLPEEDILDTMLRVYSQGWEMDEQKKKWIRNNFPAYSAVMAGYAFLEEPTWREHSRGNFLHAWAEPLFLPVRLGGLAADSWWTRNSHTHGVQWE